MNDIDVWAVLPTVNIARANTMIMVWKDRGYKVACLVNPPHEHTDLPEADCVVVQSRWMGFPIAVNILCAEVPGDIVAVIGDDLYPDSKLTAQEIGNQFREYFPDLMGVMQPTGDQYGCINKCAVSPWIGRAFINQAYGGKGPYWPEYFHYFCDEELQTYAEKIGCFQQRPDIIQYHDHWQRTKGVQRPVYLKQAKSKWQAGHDLFFKRKALGFPA